MGSSNKLLLLALTAALTLPRCADAFTGDGFERPMRGDGGVNGCKSIGVNAMSLLTIPKHVTSLDCLMPTIRLDEIRPLPRLPIPFPLPEPVGTLLELASGGFPDGSTLSLSSRFKKVGSDIGMSRTCSEVAGRVRTSINLPVTGGEAGLQAWGVKDTDGGGQCHVSVLLHPTLRLWTHILSNQSGRRAGDEGGGGHKRKRGLGGGLSEMNFSRLGQVWSHLAGGIGAEYANEELVVTCVKALHGAKMHVFGMLSGPGGFSIGGKASLVAPPRYGRVTLEKLVELPSLVAQYNSDSLEFSSVFSGDMSDYSVSFSHQVFDDVTIAGEIRKEKGRDRESSFAVAHKTDQAKVRGVVSTAGPVALEYVVAASPQLRYRACMTMDTEFSSSRGVSLHGAPRLSLSLTASA